MEMSDDYQDMSNPGGGVTMGNMPINHLRQTPDSTLSHQEEDLSDPDLQDEESGEELPQQPLQGNTSSSMDNAMAPATSTATPLNHLNTLMNTHHPHFLAKLKMETDIENLGSKTGLEALQAAMGGGFNLPFTFPPPTAFLPSQHHTPNNLPPPQINAPSTGSTAITSSNMQIPSSASSHSSESSQGSAKNGTENIPGSQQNPPTSQQPNWSFEEQFKQVRQLYEINDDPKRKEFLDDLFTYMQKRGTPINRLPIMAKSVLDLYELYNLVIARGGLVDVINKKLWQEIIKGLHLPSSITSAAFTLRTQYMKYLYPYECEKRRLSTPQELQAAIDGNRREGRRSSYGAFGPNATTTAEALVQRGAHTSTSAMNIHSQISPLSLVTAVAGAGPHHGTTQSLVNGSTAHTPLPHHPHHPHHPQGNLSQTSSAGQIPGLVPAEFEARMVEYVKLLNKEFRCGGTGTPPLMPRQGSPSPSSPSRDGAFNALEMSRLSLWNMYNNNTLYPGVHPNSNSPQSLHSPMAPVSSPEPQREALDLGLRPSPGHSPRQSPLTVGHNYQTKKENDLSNSATPAKRVMYEVDTTPERNNDLSFFNGTHIKISNQVNGKSAGDGSLAVSMELNGVLYHGVLFAQANRGNNSSSTNSQAMNSGTKRSAVS